jgi:hypothetical protein
LLFGFCIFFFCVFLSFFRFFLYFQHPQEGKLLKRHGPLSIWVDSILWSHSSNAYPFWENDHLSSLHVPLNSIRSFSNFLGLAYEPNFSS